MKNIPYVLMLIKAIKHTYVGWNHVYLYFLSLS
jgi:hypothetical protein